MKGTNVATTTAATPTGRLPRILSLITIIVGAIMIVVGISVYAFTGSMLADQNITVSAVTDEDPGALAGKPVKGPFTALAEANAILHHTNTSTDNRTYADIPGVATSDGKTYSRDVAANANTGAPAHAKGDPLSEEDAINYAARQTAMNSAFLRASLYTSVLAFGVGFLIGGVGVMMIVIGLTTFSLSRGRARA
jgi:hypothetical protein